MKTTLVAATLLAVTVAAAHAQDDYDNTQTAAGKPSVSIGGGVVIAPEYSGADSYETNPLPFISASKEITPGNTIYIRGMNAGLDHAINDQLTVGAIAGYRWKRDSSDSAMLSGMPDIDAAVELGPKIRYQITPQLGVQGVVLFDVSGVHEGYSARAGADFVQPLSEVTMLTIDGGLTYGSDDFNNTYYGVTPAQAKAGRPAYTPDAGLASVNAGVSLRHRVTNHWSVQGRLGAEYLVADVADSPLVEEELQPSLMLGLTYTF